MLIVPSALIKFALFLVLNMADMQSDAAAGKITLPVAMGETASRKLYTFSMALAYFGAIVAYLSNPISITPLILVLLTAFPAVSLVSAAMHKLPIQSLVLPCLKHAPLPVIAVFVDCFAKEILYSRSVLHFFSFDFQLRCLPIYPYLYTLLMPLITSTQKSK